MTKVQCKKFDDTFFLCKFLEEFEYSGKELLSMTQYGSSYTVFYKEYLL